MDLARYWRAVAQTRESLPPGEWIYLVSQENEATATLGGKVSVAAREYAARWIAGLTHKVAEPADIERYEADLKARTDAINKFELEKKQTIRLETAIPAEQLHDAITSALAEHAARPAKAPRG